MIYCVFQICPSSFMSCGFYFHSPLGFLACIEANRSWFTQSLSKNMADRGSPPLLLDETHQVLIDGIRTTNCNSFRLMLSQFIFGRVPILWHRLKRPPLSSGDNLAVFGAPTLEVAEDKAPSSVVSKVVGPSKNSMARGNTNGIDSEDEQT